MNAKKLRMEGKYMWAWKNRKKMLWWFLLPLTFIASLSLLFIHWIFEIFSPRTTCECSHTALKMVEHSSHIRHRFTRAHVTFLAVVLTTQHSLHRLPSKWLLIKCFFRFPTSCEFWVGKPRSTVFDFLPWNSIIEPSVDRLTAANFRFLVCVL